MTSDAYRAYSRFNHRRVNGWVVPPILGVIEALSKVQTRDGTEGGVAEIGVHHGRLFIALHLLRTPSEGSVAIDLFEDQDRNIDNSGRGDRVVFERNLDRFGGGRAGVSIIAGDSTTLSGADVRGHLGGSGIRLFSVDGGHTAEIVLHDMRTAEDALVAGGIVIADDVFNDEWPGVAEGTLNYLREGGSLVPFAIGLNKVLFASAKHADQYREVVLRLAESESLDYKDSIFGGHTVVIFGRWGSTIRRRARKVPGLSAAYKAIRNQ